MSGHVPASAGTHTRGGALDVPATAKRLTALAQRLNERHMHVTLDPREARMRADREWVRSVAASEMTLAKRHLRKVVNEARKDLGLPTVEGEAMIRIKAQFRTLGVELQKVGKMMEKS